MTEIWKDIKGYEGLYEVSNNGNVRRVGKPPLVQTMRGEYLKVSLYKNGKAKIVSIHRLVAEAFVPNHFNHPVVNHKDENKLNNSADNLEWCTLSYNTKYNGRAYETAKPKRKPVIGTNLITGEKTIFESIAEVERKGIASHSHVIGCLKGHDRRKTTGGYSWEYAE